MRTYDVHAFKCYENTGQMGLICTVLAMDKDDAIQCAHAYQEMLDQKPTEVVVTIACGVDNISRAVLERAALAEVTRPEATDGSA